jgi:hypothetical protein
MGRAWAQDNALLLPPEARQGYYLGIALGGVLNQNLDESKSYSPWLGGGNTIRFGQALTPQWDLGIAVDTHFARNAVFSGLSGGLAIETVWHPFEPLALGFSAGFSVLQIKEINDPDEDVLGGVGDYYSLSASWNFFPFYGSGSGGIAISPLVAFKVLPRGSLTSFYIWSGIELTWWTGLPTNQLALGVEEAFK